MAVNIFSLFLDDYSETDISHCVNSAYCAANFDHNSIAPLHRLEKNISVMELWHGPTYAFKDIALQVLPYLLTCALKIKGETAEIVILTATSGDTGKSALEGFRDVAGTRIIVYFPENGVSEVQRLQMTTQDGSNISVAAVKGNFDHTQAAVKAIFSNQLLADRLASAGFRLSSANSINWGRLLPQIVYYFSAYNELQQNGSIGAGERINFVVPTGNFGNILAGYYAKTLGLPVNRLICASNRNNVLADFINSGHYDSRRPLHRTISPSMDILVSSNLERLIYELNGKDSERLSAWMKELSENGFYQIDKKTLEMLQDHFWADYAGEDETMQAIAKTYGDYTYLVDTHTAVGLAVFDKYRRIERDNSPTVILSTASPFKFTGSVTKAIIDSSRYDHKSEIELLEILARETGTTIPVNLAGLKQKKNRYNNVVAPEKIHDHLLHYLNIPRQ